MTATVSEPALLVDRPLPGVLRLMLNRPRALNAVTLALADDLLAALDAADADDDARVIVLGAAGERAFSAGYDIREMAAMDGPAMVDALVRRFPVIYRIALHRKPVIAALNGLAHGAGALFAAAADIRVAAPHAEFRIAATQQGAAEGCWLLPAIVGASRAKEILMSGRAVATPEALAIGLLHAVAEDGDVMGLALAKAAEIAAHPARGPQAVKRLVNEGIGLDLPAQHRAELLALCTELRPAAGAQTFDQFLQRPPRS